MECMQERPRSSRRDRDRERSESEASERTESEKETVQDRERQVDDNVQGDEDVLANNNTAFEMNDSDRRKLQSLDTQLAEQEVSFKSKNSDIEMKKQESKEKVSDLFQQLREILAEKENELMGKIDSEFTTAEHFISDFVTNIEIEKEKVRDLLCNQHRSATIGREEDIDQIKQDVDTSLDIRKDVLIQYHLPRFVLNEDVLDDVKAINIGEFLDSVTDDTNQVGQEPTINENAEDTEGLEETTNNEAELNIDNYNDEIVEGASGFAEGSIIENENRDAKESEVRGATGMSQEVRTPTAPAIEPEESPPPYWQAVGLERPHEETQAEIPGYYDMHYSPNNRLPDNKLELWHSFPIRRQYDRRGPMPVALIWNCGRICVVDRANMRVKFFFPNGQLITEMYFNGKELHNIAFLEEANGESRYVLTIPRSKTLIIIGIDRENSPKVIRKLTFSQQYSCVCRGPKLQTLLGSEANTSYVHLFNFSGQVLFSISQTPSYGFLQYIKKIEVFGNNIIVLDYKINSVSVFQDDGSAVGEYRGTQSSPLVNPLDITLDNQGNIMILNGEFSNVHVIDQQCNFIEIIGLPRTVSSSSTSSTKLIAFDTENRRLSAVGSKGDVAIFTFEHGYECLPQRNLVPNSAPNIVTPRSSGSGRQRAPEVLPLVEGMLPSTIENIIMHQSSRNRSRQFHL